MRQWIAIVEPAQLWTPLKAADRTCVLTTPGLAGLDIRIRPGADMCARDCVEAGLPYRLHSWEGGRDATTLPANTDATEGARDAERVSAALQRIAAVAKAPAQGYGLNDERDWWKGNPTGIEALDAFATRFYELERCELAHLGYWNPAWHYGKRDWNGDGRVDTVIPTGTKLRFGRKHVMAYQRTYAQIVATLERARGSWPLHRLGAFVSIGALDADGEVIGRPDAIKRVVVERVADIEEITHYVGLPPSWQRMLLLGNSKVAPLVERIPDIAAACDEAKGA